MPIAGVVISVKPEETEEAARLLTKAAGIEIHGSDSQGHIVAVLEAESLKAMEKLVDCINALPPILNVGLTYINTEDEDFTKSDKGGNAAPSPLSPGRWRV
ncbi:MAG: chaperone NapD [Desulfobulbaceae bacterium]|nr:chaperone NapD [Desulfobulbaceae bacterium]